MSTQVLIPNRLFLCFIFVSGFFNYAKSAATADSVSSVKVCVLYFERIEHPFWTEIQKVFNGHTEAVVIPVAKPADIVSCVLKNNPQEIIIFAHAFEIDSATTKLGFFLPAAENESAEAYESAISITKKRIAEITGRRNYFPCTPSPRNTLACSEAQRNAIRLSQTLNKLEALKQTDTLYRLFFGYHKGVFFRKPFDDLSDLIKTNRFNLRKIRLMSCEPHKIFSAYPGLKTLVTQQGIKLDVAPKSRLLSVLHGMHVTTIDSDWLARSLER